MNAGVSSEKEKVKQSQSRRVTPRLTSTSGARSGASQFSGIRAYVYVNLGLDGIWYQHKLVAEQWFKRFWNCLNIDRV